MTIMHPRNARDAWITPREEVEAIPFHRELKWWEVLEVTESVTDEDYRVGAFWRRADNGETK